jgi:hypothetical protein
MALLQYLNAKAKDKCQNIIPGAVSRHMIRAAQVTALF